MTETDSVNGLILAVESPGIIALEVPFPPSKMGVMMFQNDEIHIAGFLIRSLISNLAGLALDNAGARRKRKANRAIKAAVLVSFLCIGASFNRLGTPCRTMGNNKTAVRAQIHHSYPRRTINLRNCGPNVKRFF